MLKRRIIPKFLIRDGRLVKGVRFHENFREAGNPVSTAKVYDAYGVDEMMFVDIDASRHRRSVAGSIIERVSEEVFMPFTVGGGIDYAVLPNFFLRAEYEYMGFADIADMKVNVNTVRAGAGVKF